MTLFFQSIKYIFFVEVCLKSITICVNELMDEPRREYTVMFILGDNHAIVNVNPNCLLHLVGEGTEYFYEKINQSAKN